MVKFNKFEEIFLKGTLRDFFAIFFFFKNWKQAKMVFPKNLFFAEIFNFFDKLAL